MNSVTEIPKPLITHLGLGDGILQSGAVVVCAERYGKIAVPCYERYEVSTKSFFASYPQISIYTLPHHPSFDWGSPPEWVWRLHFKQNGLAGAIPLRCGVYAGLGLDEDFSKSFYKHLNVPYEARWDRSPLLEAWKQVEQLGSVQWPSERRIFLHDDPLRGFVIWKLLERKQCFRPDFSNAAQSILRYVSLILEAEEIHVIDSAFFHLVNTFQPTAKLFLHQYPRWPRSIAFRYPSRLNWQYVR